MMREIKFRGRRVDNGEWVYGCLGRHTLLDAMIIDRPYLAQNGDLAALNYWMVGPSTVGQFTGWQDVDGNDIYEGDMVEFLGDRVYRGIVSYQGTAFVVKADGITDTLDAIDIELQNLIVLDTIHEEA